MPGVLSRARRLLPTPSLALGVLFLGAVLGFFPGAVAGSGPALAQCQPQQPPVPITLKAVIDGDTLRLNDGRLLRLVGVNTPELGRDGAPDQPLARAARSAVDEWLQPGQVLYAEPGSEVRDRHGRWLASVFLRPDGGHLGERLLSRGLAWQVAVPPNLRHLDCLRAAEARARSVGLGVWSEPAHAARHVSTLEPGAGGFMRLYGTVSRVADDRRGWWIEVEGHLSLRLEREDLHYFPTLTPSMLLGDTVTVRGWVADRGEQRRGHPRHRMPLRHALMLESAVVAGKGDLR